MPKFISKLSEEFKAVNSVWYPQSHRTKAERGGCILFLIHSYVCLYNNDVGGTAQSQLYFSFFLLDLDMYKKTQRISGYNNSSVMNKVFVTAIHNKDIYIVSLLGSQILAPLHRRRGAEELLTFIMTQTPITHT